MWFTDNQVDRMGDDIPPEELNRAPNAGLDFGFPGVGAAILFIWTICPSLRRQEILKIKDGSYASRPTHVAKLPDGSLLVADDEAGALDRITYEGEPRRPSDLHLLLPHRAHRACRAKSGTGFASGRATKIGYRAR